MASYCDYKISQIIKDGNSCSLIARFYEGEIVEVEREVNGELVKKNEYIRVAPFATPVELFFDYYPVPNEDIHNELIELLNEVRGTREVIV